MTAELKLNVSTIQTNVEERNVWDSTVGTVGPCKSLEYTVGSFPKWPCGLSNVSEK
jgi:hypothetical protein